MTLTSERGSGSFWKYNRQASGRQRTTEQDTATSTVTMMTTVTVRAVVLLQAAPGPAGTSGEKVPAVFISLKFDSLKSLICFNTENQRLKK